MNIIRKGIAILSAFALAAVAGTAAAAPTKQFTIDVSPSTVAPNATGVVVSVIVSNETPNGNSAINSMHVTVPAGLTIVGTVTAKTLANATYTTNPITTSAGLGGTTIININGMTSLLPKQAFKLVFNVNVGASCGSLTWVADAYTGNSFGGDTFLFLTAAVMAVSPFNRKVNQTTNITGSQDLVISSPAEGSSVLKGANFDVKATLTNSCLADLSGISVSFANTDGSAGGYIDGSATTNSSGVATYTGKFTSAGDATITASASGGYPSPTVDLKVFDNANTACMAAPDALDLLDPAYDPQFQSPDGGASIGITGYLAGIRGFDDSKAGQDSASCATVDVALVNNIPTTNTVVRYDPEGNTVPTGYFSFTFSTPDPDNPPVVGLVTTYRPEWGDDTNGGLPKLQTRICTNAGCSTTKVLPACLSSIVARTSLPTGETACLAAETWKVVSADSCTGTQPDPPRCLQATSVIIAGEDPVFGR